MSLRLRLVLGTAAAIAVAMFLFPPWSLGDGRRMLGYAPLWGPPSRTAVAIDFARLGVQVLALCAATGLAIAVVGFDRRR